MPKVQVHDIQMYYEERGEGFPLMLIMGLGANLDWWGDELWDTLASEYRVIAFDNRGAGRTDVPQSPYSIAGFAQDTVGLMDALGLDKAHVFGCSMGGMIAQETALEYPTRVGKLVLGCTFCGGVEAVQPSPEVLQTLATPNIDPGAAKRGLTKLLFPDAFVEKNQAFIDQNWLRLNEHPMDPGSLFRQVMAIAQWGTFERLPGLQAPTLVLHGTEDILVPAPNAEILGRQIPNAIVKLYEGAGHGFTGQAPREVAAEVLAFLRS